VCNAVLHHTSIQNRCEDHRLVRRQKLPLTDRKRQKRFDDRHDASTVRHELRSLCPRNAKVINIEVAQDGPPSRRGNA
jgi:hypothetical protein